MRSDRERLLDVQEAIQRIEKYAARGRQVFEEDELIQNWIIHHIQIIGEAVVRLSQDLLTRHPEVPWKQIIGMRNILVHDCFGIDTALVWSVVEREIPRLKAQVAAILPETAGP